MTIAMVLVRAHGKQRQNILEYSCLQSTFNIHHSIFRIRLRMFITGTRRLLMIRLLMIRLLMIRLLMIRLLMIRLLMIRC